MEHTLRCNVLKCRKELDDRALVTTCSHIFCIECADRLGLTGHGRELRKSCPACRTQLTNLDDAVISNLNPSEDYKTSVLSGLSPNVIVECASRALSFWAYQATQEVTYQEHLSKALTEKYSNLSVYLDKVIHDANTEITNLQSKVTAMKTDQDSLRRKNDELTQICKEKNRKLLQTQELYDKLKRKAMLGQIQDAAEDAIDSTLYGQSTGKSQFEGESQNTTGYEEPGTPYDRHLHEQQRFPVGYQPQAATQNYSTSWPKTMGAQSNVPITPSTHRQRINDPAPHNLSNIPGIVAGTPLPQQPQMSMRPPQGVAQRPTPISSALNPRPATGQPETILGGIRSGFTNF
ncbi:hypothetical protein M426DRAFT_7602 [Hypoxylon sp. CI-4A]|nr:hypothetical protein M426DRAFT_7602 [Hypoxylon sp. CI-4A]